jgi:hypothetical protein
MDDESGGLFNIAISDSEAEDQTASSTKSGRRTDQFEADYQAVKQTYHAKVENGEVRDCLVFFIPFSLVIAKQDDLTMFNQFYCIR